MASTSNTYSFELSNSDILIEAFDRCEVRPSALTAEHLISGRRSLNLELQSWGNDVPKLWVVDLITIPLVQGILTYDIPANTITLLDTYVRQFSLSTTFNVTPLASTTISSDIVNLLIPNYGLMDGGWLNITTPLAVGGIVLQGFYQVVDSIDANNFTIQASEAATATITNGGAVPLFTAIGGESTMQVTLVNHGLSVNSLFNVAVQTSVGGVVLSGSYTINWVQDANNFFININQQTSYNDAVSENTGLLQIQAQTANVPPVDYIMEPFGRTDYAAIPNKTAQGRPTTYWYDRLINPTITLWQAPDGSGPYELRAYRMRQIQDANPAMGQVSEIPQRFYDALCARMAQRLSVKYAKAMYQLLKSEADIAYGAATTEDRERADLYIQPILDGYYRD